MRNVKPAFKAGFTLWWTYRESDPRLDYAIVARYHYAIGPLVKTL